MNYLRIYSNLIANAKIRQTTEYTESHHIIPRCRGGSDERENLIRLTAREHYLAHWLLAKGYRDRKLVFAWRAMAMDPLGKRYSSHTFKYAREAWSRAIAEANRGLTFSAERLANLSKSHIGQKAWNKGMTFPKTEGYKQRRADYYANPKICVHCGSPIPYKMRLRENRQYCSQRCYLEAPGTGVALTRKAPHKANSGSFKPGNTISKETASKISDKLTGMKRPRGICPHCGKEGAVSLLKRWHFDNCKELKC